MARRELPFSHEGADERFAEYPLGPGDTYGENLARSEGVYPLAAAVVRGWAESPGHRCNLLGPFTSCGVGAATDGCGVTFVVQLLARAPGDGGGGAGAAPEQPAEEDEQEKGPEPLPPAGLPWSTSRSAFLWLVGLLGLLAWKGGWLPAWA
mmetsp:Transcript_11121/g.34475  ORF Transcript_11121/g.34475 Transcript_11121/m.34475 type:complete len:151 (-) Transcript_11121:73-525(-)